MAVYKGELGLQFVTHLANHYTVPELVRLAALAHEKGFDQIWINDNIRYRGQMVILTAIAARVPIRLGTAVLVPYFHQPLDLADSLAALSELCNGREISIGLARGDLGQAAQHIEIFKPIALVRETAQFLRQALRGEDVPYDHFPVLREYYRLNRKGRFRLAFEPLSPFRFYGGGNGPQALRMCGRVMDGIITSGTFIPMVRAGRQARMLAKAEKAAEGVDPRKRLHKICELNVSISADRAKAMEFPRRQVAHSVLQWEALGLGPDEYAKLKVDRKEVLTLAQHFQAGGTVEEAAALVSDDMIRANYAAGTPDEVVEQILELLGSASDLGYDQVAFAKLGPDYDEAINLIASEVMPALQWALSS